MRKRKQAGYIMRHRGWWVLRVRERVGVGGLVKTVHRAHRLAPIDVEHKTRASVRRIAEKFLESLNQTSVSPLSVTTIGDFCDRVYFPFLDEYKRPSTVRGYKQIWKGCLKERCHSLWMREIKTHHVQTWLEEIARECRKYRGREYTLSKTTLRHVKHFLSGLFRYAAQQEYLDSGRANPVTAAGIPASAPAAAEGRAYSLEEVRRMLEVLSEPAATVVATAAYTGLRQGELRGLVWEAYTPGLDPNLFGMIYVTRSVWRGFVGDPKTQKSKAPVPVIPQLAERLDAHRAACGNPRSGPIFANSRGMPADLEGLYRLSMKDVLCRAGIVWSGWHGFRRGLASNLNRLGTDDSVIQSILRHTTVATTQAHYIKTTRPDAVAAMREFSDALKRYCAPDCAPAETRKPQATVQ